MNDPKEMRILSILNVLTECAQEKKPFVHLYKQNCEDLLDYLTDTGITAHANNARRDANIGATHITLAAQQRVMNTQWKIIEHLVSALEQRAAAEMMQRP